jgi:hypothetical protein
MPAYRFSVAFLPLLALAGCGRAPVPAPGEAAETTAVPPGPPVERPAADEPSSTAAQAPPLVPEAEKGEKGARNVLLAWARALEQGDYATAFAQWGGEAEERSGMTAAEHAAWWGRFETITVAMPAGTMEGAAGSSYYEAPTTVVGKRKDGTPYRLVGTVVLRWVNDVPGATPDQLRWHIEKVDLAPA